MPPAKKVPAKINYTSSTNKRKQTESGSSQNYSASELQEEVHTLRTELEETNKQLKKCRSELKSTNEWVTHLERQHQDELDYAKAYDDDGYCRGCGKSCCRC